MSDDSKYQSGKKPADQWVLCIVEHDGIDTKIGRVRYLAIPDRKKSTLTNIISKHATKMDTIFVNRRMNFNEAPLTPEQQEAIHMNCIEGLWAKPRYNGNTHCDSPS